MSISNVINSEDKSVCCGYILNIIGYILLLWNILNVVVTGMYLQVVTHNIVYNIMSYVIFTHCLHVLEPICMIILYRSIKIFDCPLHIYHIIVTLNNFIACLVISIYISQNNTIDSFLIYTISYICSHCVAKLLYMICKWPTVNIIGIWK